MPCTVGDRTHSCAGGFQSLSCNWGRQQALLIYLSPVWVTLFHPLPGALFHRSHGAAVLLP